MLKSEFKLGVFICDVCEKEVEVRIDINKFGSDTSYMFDRSPKDWIKTSNNFGAGSVCSRKCLMEYSKREAKKLEEQILQLN